ncbi:MAG: SEL1-like repeat protein [Phycisphaerales bacterium]|nr:SEL1-like repeat protein [Hyphomonadaceae bacterium]
MARDALDAYADDAADDFVLGDDDVFCTVAFAGNDTPLAPRVDAEAAQAPVAETGEDELPPFDAPEEDDEIFQELRVIETLADDGALLLTTPSASGRPLTAHPAQAGGAERPLPAIAIHASWDRSEIAKELFAKLAADPRTRRASISVGRGGIDGAAERFTSESPPDLLLLESTLKGADMLGALDRLAPLVAQGAKIVLLGGVNDIGLLRELAARGVSEYVVPPIAARELVGQLCRLYASVDKARVIAVIGARGGVGASTVAHNVAWCIAERQQRGAAIVDLDLPFGTAALNFQKQAPRSIGEAFAAAERADDALIDELVLRQTPRLQIFSAPATLDADMKLNAEALAHVLAKVRRTSSHVVLDLPHLWSAWVKDALLRADDVIIVSGPDLASLSSAKGMLEALKEQRADIAPLVVLSMVGVPKRPEIALKEFAAALGAEPVLALPFDPALFGAAAMSGKMIGEVAPHSKIAAALDQLATTLTGHEPVAARAKAGFSAPVAAPALAPSAPGIEEDASVRGALKRLKRAHVVAAAPHAFIARAREAAQSRQPGARPAKRPTSTVLRAMTALTTLFVISVWLIENQRPSAAAAEAVSVAIATQPTPAPAPVAAPDPALQFEAAVQHLNAGRSAEGATLLRALAESDFAPAQHRLAKLYESGAGVETNLAQALRWTERAAEGGEARAMHDLGVYHARGEVTAIDAVAAFRWFRQAADLGVADSQYNLGVLYEQGRGVSADPAEALFWFTVAARQGDETAAERATGLATRLTPMAAGHARARAEAFQPAR